MCGAGALPALVAERARRQGWRLVAFAFDGAPDLGGRAEQVWPAQLTDLGAVLARLREAAVEAVVLCGRFSMPAVLRTPTEAADPVARALEARAGSRVDARLAGAVIGTLATLGIEVLDQRRFLGDLLARPGRLAGREPTEPEWRDVRRGLEVARLAAEARVGQTVVVCRGAVTAVEAVEGTTEAIRRGTALAGPGAVIVKAVARDHDYRFDTPLVGPDTVAAAAAGSAAVLAVEAGRVAVFEPEATARAAERAGLSLVGVDGDG